jgi:hypothetical protein
VPPGRSEAEHISDLVLYVEGSAGNAPWKTALRKGNRGLRFGIRDSWFGIAGLGFGVWDLGFGILCLGFKARGMDLGFKIWDQGLGFGILDLGSRFGIWDLGFEDLGLVELACLRRELRPESCLEARPARGWRLCDVRGEVRKEGEERREKRETGQSRRGKAGESATGPRFRS